MALHELSSVAVLDQFGLWGVPPTQVSVDRDITSDYRPVAVLKADQPITFVVGSAVDEYMVLSESYFYLKFRINLTKDDKSSVVADDWKTVYPANNLLYSFFKSLEIMIGDKVITLNSQNIAYRAYFDIKLGFSSAAKKGHLSTQFWIDDKSKRSTFIRPNGGNLEKGCHVELIGKLPIDLGLQNRALLGGCTLTARLTSNEPNFYFEVPTGFKVRTEYLDSILYIHKAKVTSELVVAHAKALAVAPARYPICRGEVKPHSVLKGSYEFTISNAIVGIMPTRMFLAMVDSHAYNGDYTKDPYYFHHYDLNYIVSYVDGTPFPHLPYEPDFSNNCFLRELNALYQTLNQNGTDCYTDIDRESFAKGNTIIPFNYAPDLSSGPGVAGHLSPRKSGALRVVAKFKNPLPHNINVLLFCIYDDMIEIDQHRNAFTTYN